MKIIVYHGLYGCDTGCCGHYVKLQDDLGKLVEERFEFKHPRGEDMISEAAKLEWAKEFIAKQFGEEHVKDLDWEHCEIVDD